MEGHFGVGCWLGVGWPLNGRLGGWLGVLGCWFVWFVRQWLGEGSWAVWYFGYFGSGC